MTDDRTNETTENGRDDLPLPDYDHLPVGTLAHRVRQLDAPALEKVVAYERAHGHRMPVLAVLEQRLEELRAGAEPSGGDPATPTPAEVFPPRRGGASKASPQTAAEPGKRTPHGGPGHRSEPRG